MNDSDTFQSSSIESNRDSERPYLDIDNNSHYWTCLDSVSFQLPAIFYGCSSESSYFSKNVKFKI